jgi:hypothetical protein
MAKYKIFILILLSSFVMSGYEYSSVSSSENGFPSVDYLNMKGTKYSHTIHNSSDSLSDNTIIELQDENGVTCWYGRYFHKDICTTGVCKMVKLWIFWDAIGNYLGIQLDENESLTKSDHTPFEMEDYKRLDRILSDTLSVFKDLNYEDLIVEDDSQPKEETNRENKLFAFLNVDAVSTATSPALKEYVIEKAVFTCYTLWHTVYGETKVFIDSLIRDKLNAEYIGKLLNGEEEQIFYGLEILQKYNSYFPEFDTTVFSMVTSPKKELSRKALTIIPTDYLRTPDHQLRFIKLIDNSLYESKLRIIYRLQSIDNVSADAIVLLLDKYIQGIISKGSLNMIYIVIANNMNENNNLLDNKDIASRLKLLSNHSDTFIANLTNNFLQKY